MANLKISAASANAACAAMVALLNGGKLIVYDGAQPATPATAITTQVALVTFDPLEDPAFGAPSDGPTGATATLDNPPAVPADATGTASWFRAFDDAGNAVWDGDVTNTAGAGNLKISSTAVVEDIDVSIVSLTFRMAVTA
jgi:hypothetical protein